MTQPHPSPRMATLEDLPSIVSMLIDDSLGATREELTQPLPSEYVEAFEAIDSDPNQELVVVEREGRLVGTLQITYIPGLSRKGSWRAQIEAVRVHEAARGAGLGQFLMQWSIDRARHRGCRLVQLTSDKQRVDAHRFYDNLGFVASHEGYKLHLDES